MIFLNSRKDKLRNSKKQKLKATKLLERKTHLRDQEKHPDLMVIKLIRAYGGCLATDS